MPQLIALALVGAGLYAGYRWFSRTTKEITAEIKRTEDELRRRAAGGILEKDMGELEYDPASGVYRPKRR
ncbi:MAG: hypothetical protein K2X43_25540 [Hyphomonadaceae bacterium]|jgi:type II secretory pathway component PulJ|nr:hypothetical protein [Hyphomonadaceae bacterium]